MQKPNWNLSAQREIRLTTKNKQENDNNQNPANSFSKEKPNTTNNENPNIDLKNVKQITLTNDGKLVIEFNNIQNGSTNQILTEEQINNNQELKNIKDYCQQNGKINLIQQEINDIINANKTSSPTTTSNPEDNKIFGIGLVVVVTLIIGIGVIFGLILKKRKKLIRRN